jgi:HAL2 family 3'(2'),5'-bisphosphate nucleotidase
VTISAIGRILVDRMVKVVEMTRSVQAIAQNSVVAKQDSSPVTIVDLAVQTALTHILQEEIGSIRMVGEENSDLLRRPGSEALCAAVVHATGLAGVDIALQQTLSLLDLGSHQPEPTDTYWVLDPIDGTKGFLRGDQYAIALAMVESGKVTRGILACPALEIGGSLGAIAVAERGHGAWLLGTGGEFRRLHVSTVHEVVGARFCESVESGHSAHGWSSRVAEELGITAPPVRLDSQAKYLALAAGLADIYLRLPVRKDYVEKVWDHAAGSIIVEEAGGIVSDCTGAPLDFVGKRQLSNNSGVVVSTTHLHADVIAAIQRTL